MPQVDGQGDRPATWIRWIARGLGSLMAGMWLFVGAVSAMTERDPWTLESALMAAFTGALALGVVVAWRRERLGGTVLVITALAFSTFAYFSAGRNKGYAMLVSGAPFLVVGLLFLAAWRRSLTADRRS